MQIHPDLACPYRSSMSHAMKHMSSHQLNLLGRAAAGVLAILALLEALVH